MCYDVWVCGGSRPDRGNSRKSFSPCQETGKDVKWSALLFLIRKGPWRSASYRPCASPSKATITPGLTTSPSKATITPGLTTSPSKATITPGLTTSPSKATITPGLTTSPSKATITPGLTTSPSKATITPGLTTSPSKATITPGLTTSPSKATITPGLTRVSTMFWRMDHKNPYVYRTVHVRVRTVHVRTPYGPERAPYVFWEHPYDHSHVARTNPGDGRECTYGSMSRTGLYFLDFCWNYEK